MFAFEKTDEGLYCTRTSDGHAVARIDTVTVTETNDANLRVQKKVETPIPFEKWQIHFCSTKLTPEEVTAFVDALAECEEG